MISNDFCIGIVFLFRFSLREEYLVYPHEGVCSHTPKGSNIFPFYWYRKRFSGYQKHQRRQTFLKTWKCFIWWGWVSGWVDWTEYQMGPWIFFILCVYIHTVYTYLFFNQKLSPTFIWVSKFDVKLRSWDFMFKSPIGNSDFEKSY